jgi:hypothetical protein
MGHCNNFVRDRKTVSHKYLQKTFFIFACPTGACFTRLQPQCKTEHSAPIPQPKAWGHIFSHLRRTGEDSSDAKLRNFLCYPLRGHMRAKDTIPPPSLRRSPLSPTHQKETRNGYLTIILPLPSTSAKLSNQKNFIFHV